MNLGRKTALIAAALSLSATPVIASAAQASAQSLSVAEFTQARAGAPVTDESQLEGENGILIAILAAAAVIAGIIIIVDDDDPTSP